MVNPSALARYDVIHVYYEFEGQVGERKFFVVLSHGDKHAICIKATAKVEKYQLDQKQKAGCVCYKANEVPCFVQETAIQPHNVVPISYEHIVREDRNGRYENKGTLPPDFHVKLVGAIRASIVMSPKRKRFVLELIGEVL